MGIETSKVAAWIGVAAVAVVAGCAYGDDSPRRLPPDPRPYAPDSAASRAGGGDTSSSAPPRSSRRSPMLVEVDADQTMDAVGGEGVGVFIEYATGGHWHIWWTCDTKQTRQSCEFSVSVVAAVGDLANIDASELKGAVVRSPAPSRVEVRSTTTTEIHGLRFDTSPGAMITLDASVGGLRDGAFLFFVQDGKVNGGFAGELTNPLQLQSHAP